MHKHQFYFTEDRMVQCADPDCHVRLTMEQLWKMLDYAIGHFNVPDEYTEGQGAIREYIISTKAVPEMEFFVRPEMSMSEYNDREDRDLKTSRMVYKLYRSLNTGDPIPRFLYRFSGMRTD